MKTLKIAIVHHHLRGGGVTKVIERAVEALLEYPVKVCVISGEEGAVKNSSLKKNHLVVSGLSYGEKTPPKTSSELKNEVIKRATEYFGEKVDVWHIHNHTLGKNAAYTEFGTLLAEQGEHVYFQLHDFSEDNRPLNYVHLAASIGQDGASVTQKMYPLGSHVLYGVLNGRDHGILKKAGIAEDKLNIVSNPVVVQNRIEYGNRPALKGIEKLFLYPVRAIPRKNIGELAFWSALANEGEHFAITLAPKNLKYQKFYKQWVEYAEEMNLPITFEAGKKWGLSYPELLDTSYGIVTTSIQEGFGLVYLESWVQGKPLYGRILPDITRDFYNNEIRFPGMYTRLMIPVEWVGEMALKAELRQEIKKLLKNYGQKFSTKNVESWLEVMLEEKHIDFGRLSSALQRKVITLIMKNPGLQKELPVLESTLIEAETIQSNKRVVEEEYNLEEYGESLYQLYKKLAVTTPSVVEYVEPDGVLHQFLSPVEFSLLRG